MIIGCRVLVASVTVPASRQSQGSPRTSSHMSPLDVFDIDEIENAKY